MIEILSSLFYNYRWALTILLFILLRTLLLSHFPQLADNEEVMQAIRALSDWMLWALFGLFLRIPRIFSQDQNIDSAWQLFKESVLKANTNRNTE